jgi:hypothetical protein
MDESLLQSMVDSIVEEAHPEEMRLFGSRAQQAVEKALMAWLNLLGRTLRRQRPATQRTARQR